MTDNKLLFLQSKKNCDKLKLSYKDNGTIDWATFSNDQESHKEKIVKVVNDDFKYGTLRIKQPCMIVLQESISFNPNRPTTWLTSSDTITATFADAVKIDPNRVLDWFPNPTQPNNAQYYEPDISMAYTLGFFAAITVETCDVIIDLNGYVLEQSKEHALQQRFYANIELADQPFIMNQGPSNFGNVLRSARNFWLCNGKVGRSSHHGIHGNGATYIFVDNVDFEDFEVAAISLNSSKCVYYNKVNIIKNRTDVPILGTYSAGRFIKSFVDYLQTHAYSTPQLDTAFDILKLGLDNAFNSNIFNNGAIDALFKNESGLIDGNAYGIVVNPAGVAVLNLAEGRASSKANETSNVYFDHCNVNGIHCNIREIVTIDNGYGKIQTDTAGSVFQFFNGVSKEIDGKYYYDGTMLSDVQIELAKIRTSRINVGLPVSMFGTLNIDEGIQHWKDNKSLYFMKIDNKLKLFDHPFTYAPNGNQFVYNIICNGDSMFHVNKGAIGVRIDGCNTVNLNNCSVTNISNIGESGSLLSGEYIKSHPGQGKMIGYGGSKSYGIIFSAVNDMTCDNLNIDTVISKNGTAIGVVVQNESYNCKIENLKINNVTSSIDTDFEQGNYKLPNLYPVSSGILISHDIFNISIKNIFISNVKNNINNPFNRCLDIHSTINLE
jgi:hypothetical protein